MSDDRVSDARVSDALAVDGRRGDLQAGERYATMRRVTLVGAAVDGLLAVAKIAGGIVGHSQALVVDGVHSASDLVTDVMVLEADIDPVVRLANLLYLPRALTFRIHGESGGWPVFENSTGSLWLAIAVWTTASVAWIWMRYRRLLVRR